MPALDPPQFAGLVEGVMHATQPETALAAVRLAAEARIGQRAAAPPCASRR